jgi:hypothetical protein
VSNSYDFQLMQEVAGQIRDLISQGGNCVAKRETFRGIIERLCPEPCGRYQVPASDSFTTIVKEFLGEADITERSLVSQLSDIAGLLETYTSNTS